MLTVSDLDYQWPNSSKKLLYNLNLNINNGELVALVGDNGAGKSTLMRLIAGLLKPSSGTVIFNQHNVHQLKAQQRAPLIGILFQEAERQIFKSRVFDEVAFGLEQQGMCGEALKEKVQQTLEMCQLADVAESHPLDLNSGQRRMVAVATLAAMNPPLLLLDEPTRDFDAHWLEIFAQWLKQCHQQGTTVLAISHDYSYIKQHFERVITLENGQISIK
ncbi:MAG: energy-coupling factor ABC transporter ATP-binding protein [Vibrio sp.]